MENVLTEDLLRGTVLDKSFDKPDFKPRKVKVKIIRREGGWLPDDHEAAVMMDGSKRIFCVPLSASRRQLVNPLAGLSVKQLNELAYKVGLKDGESFNIHKKKEDNYWTGSDPFEVILTRDGDNYDLSDPVNFLKWATLRSDTDHFAPSWDERFMRGTYQFALIEEGEEDTQKITKADKMKEAYMLFGRLEENEGKMRDFLWVYSISHKDAKNPPKQATHTTLKILIADIVDNQVDRFLELANDPDYQTKVLIKKGMNVGAIALRRGKYYLGDNPDPVGGLNDLIEHLDDDDDQQDRMKIMALIDKANEE